MTPIQTAMFKIAQMRQTENENVLMQIDANQVATLLSDLRLDEQKLISDTYDEGFKHCCRFSNGDDYDGPKQTYINSLNPVK